MSPLLGVPRKQVESGGAGHNSGRGHWLEAALVIQQETDGGLDWGGGGERQRGTRPGR